LVERSVKRGLLVREVDSSDRRRALVTLTDDGQGLLDHITRANRRELGSLEDSLFRRSLIDALRNQASEP
jgi:DNA-binding MarR family transcriptional regulator